MVSAWSILYGNNCLFRYFINYKKALVLPQKIRCLTSFKNSTMTQKESKIDAVLVDLSGTLHVEDTAIAGAQSSLQRLRDANLKVKFVTNTTKEPLRLLYNRLQKLNFDISENEIFTSLTAARQFVESRGLRPLLFLEESAKEDFKGIPVNDPNAVVIGLAPSCFHYEALTEAFRLLLNGCPLIAIHKARYFKKKDGLHLGPGAFVTGLEYSADVKADVVGKPEKAFFLEAIHDTGCNPTKTVMIGDDVRDDVGGAMQAGMYGILVKTGKYRQGDENKIYPGPSATCDDFPHAVEFILSKLA